MTDTFDVSGYLSVFLDEVDEQIEALSTDILVLEKNSTDKETIQKIFRAAHTLKGSSGAMGFTKLQELTHSMENVLDKIRHEEMYVSSDIITVLFECLDALKYIKDSIVNQNCDDYDTSELIEKLSSLGKTEVKEEPENKEVQAEFSLTFDEVTKQVIREGIAQGYRALAVYIRIAPDSQMKSIRAFLVANNLKEVADVISSFPRKEDLDNDKINDSFIYFVITNESETKIIDIVNRISEILAVSIREIKLEDLEEHKDEEKEPPDFDFDILKQAGKSEVKRIQSAEEVKKTKIAQVMRVDVDKIDFLMNLIGELVINQTRMTQLSSTLKAKFRNNEDVESILEVSQHAGRIVSSLQEGVMKVRMLPIEQLFNRFPRMVRDLSLTSGKKINFSVEGQDTELDRTLIEEISDPLIHLLRNSIDHGIEEPEKRISAGKSEEGSVKISARHKDNMTEIVVEDDGKGIDAALIRLSAVKKGILSQEEADSLSDSEAVNLIFMPGFSTSSTINEVSGRGVGMDIVRAHIEKVNGIIDIETEVGRGTRFVIKLPITLAIIPSLMIKVGETMLAIPMSSVLEIVRVESSEISSVNKREAAVIRGRVLPLVRLHKRFNAEYEKKKNTFIVVIGIAEKRVGVVVDKLLGNQEVVIKALGKYIGKIEGISGATILGDGNIALILDSGYIVKKAVKDMAINRD